MAEKLFLKTDAVKFGWEKVTKNLVFFILISLTVLFANSLSRISDAIWGPSVILAIVFFLIKSFIDIGVIRIALNFVDNSPSKYADLFSGIPYFLKYLAALILVMLILSVPFILIIPGILSNLIFLVVIGAVVAVFVDIIVGIRLMFFGAFIVDKNAGTIDALKRSFAITKGLVWDLFLFIMIIVLINLLGILCLGVGLLITMPLTTLAMYSVYRKIEKSAAA